MNLQEKVTQLNTLLNELRLEGEQQQAQNQFTEETCPLESIDTIRHYTLSQMLDGMGCWKWSCPFCGTEFQE